MGYYINPTVFSSAFTVPTSVADKHLKLASGEHIKVLLFIMRNMDGIDENKIAEAIGISAYEVKEALLYWADAGILLPAEGEKQKEETEIKPKAVKRVSKPERTDIALRGAEDEKIRYLLTEAQMKLGRNLKSNEASTLVWLYDDEGLDVSIILMIVQYAVAHNKANMRFIEATAVDWINKGVSTLNEADEELRKIELSEQAWGVVCSAFGIEKRKPGKKESELALLWVDTYKMSKKMLSAAYEVCVDSKAKLSFPYIAKILENWHNKGYKTPEETETKNTAKPKENFAAYDIDLFEKMLNTKD